MNADRDANLDSGSDDIFIKDLPAPSHISDGFAEAVSPRAGGFLEHDHTSWGVFRDRPGAFGRGRRCGGLRDLSPRERGHYRQGYR